MFFLCLVLFSCTLYVVYLLCFFVFFYYVFFFKQKTAYEVRISDWSSDVCSSDLHRAPHGRQRTRHRRSPREWGVRLVLAGVVGWIGYLSVKIGRASCRERVCQYV